MIELRQAGLHFNELYPKLHASAITFKHRFASLHYAKKPGRLAFRAFETLSIHERT